MLLYAALSQQLVLDRTRTP